ncbi:MAG: phosphoribosylaminoimidazolesuccinocarboxamide synthase, partial [Muribaculaceae bacterium]|nr:phosphoribosylaminoimidazolesuccinocarboxamide synthase [Muribaculaceae bacterium]
KFEKGEPQRQLSKEFVRQWLIDHNFMNRPGDVMPELTDAFVESISDRYIELYEEITGTTFERATDVDLAARIERNVTQWLKDN